MIYCFLIHRARLYSILNKGIAIYHRVLNLAYYNVIYCTILHSIVLYSFIQQCIILNYKVLYCSLIYITVLDFITRHYILLSYMIIQYTLLHSNILYSIKYCYIVPPPYQCQNKLYNGQVTLCTGFTLESIHKYRQQDKELSIWSLFFAQPL